MNKVYYTLLILSLALTACTDSNKNQETALQKDVLNIHEKVMADDELAMINKMKLDTLIQKAISLKTDSSEVKALREKLNQADEAMSDWMKKFNPDYSGKSHDEIVKYLTDQKTKVNEVDAMLINATKESSEYLAKIKK